jgi:tetratricopeptide (TPR) repeat protein
VLLVFGLFGQPSDLLGEDGTKSKEVGEAISRGNSALERGDASDAIVEYGRAIAIDGQNAEAYYKRGLASQILGDFSNAISDYSEAIRLNRQLVGPYYYRGTVYSQMGKYKLAIADLSRAIELKPNEIDPYLQRGKAYRKVGEMRLADRDARECRKLVRKDQGFTSGPRQSIFEGLQPADWPPTDIETDVSAVANGGVRIPVGRDDGLFVGHRLVVVRNGKEIGNLTVTECNLDDSFARFTAVHDTKPIVGDLVRVPARKQAN